MSDVVTDDGAVRELTDRSEIIAQGGDPDRDTLEDTDVGAGDDREVVEDAGAEEIVAAAEGGEGAGQEAETGEEPDGGGTEAAWYGEEDVELAKSYGLTEQQLANFSDADEFQRAALFFDQTLKAQPPEVQTDTPSVEEPQAEQSESVELDPEWYAQNGYEEDTVKVVKALRAEMDRRAALEQQITEIAAWREQAELQRAAERRQAMIESFHDAVDSLDDDLFGKSIVDDKVADLGEGEEANRRKLYEAIQTYGDRFGDVPMRVKVRRALNVEFGDVLRERDRKQLVDRVAQQSRKRRPVASANRMRTTVKQGPASPENPNDISHIVADQNFQSAWKRVVEESGG